MARLARFVLPGIPHHVTQRGNARQQTFFDDGDYAARNSLKQQARNMMADRVAAEQLAREQPLRITVTVH